ncbi:MAG: Type secretion system protein [Pseudomonadota bacterium]|jgi:type II secretory pathway component PulC|nr:hypothetical protein [Zoogloea sp.]MBP7626721.1 hypothetical protein [Zoogloea sp.]
MQGFDYDRIQRFVVIIGVAAVAALWLAEETGLLMVAPPIQKSMLQAAAPDGVPLTPLSRLVLQGVIPGSGSAPGIAILAEVGKHPQLVQEGFPYNEDIRVERVMPDHVVLRRKGDSLPIALPLTVLPGVTAPDGQKPPDGHPEATPRPPENGTQSVEKSDKT